MSSSGMCRNDAGAFARAAILLADELKRADQRGGELAEVADQAGARGGGAGVAYDALGD